MFLRKLQLGRILHRDDPLAIGNEGADDVESGSFSRPSASRNHHVPALAYAQLQKLAHLRRQGGVTNQILHLQRVALEFPNRETPSLKRNRWHAHVDPAPT